MDARFTLKFFWLPIRNWTVPLFFTLSDSITLFQPKRCLRSPFSFIALKLWSELFLWLFVYLPSFLIKSFLKIRLFSFALPTWKKKSFQLIFLLVCPFFRLHLLSIIIIEINSSRELLVPKCSTKDGLVWFRNNSPFGQANKSLTPNKFYSYFDTGKENLNSK